MQHACRLCSPGSSWHLDAFGFISRGASRRKATASSEQLEPIFQGADARPGTRRVEMSSYMHGQTCKQAYMAYMACQALSKEVKRVCLGSYALRRFTFAVQDSAPSLQRRLKGLGAPKDGFH